MIKQLDRTNTSYEQLEGKRPDVRTWKIISMPCHDTDEQYRALHKAGIDNAPVVYVIDLTAYVPYSLRSIAVG